MTACPSDFALDALHLRADDAAEIRRHVETCDACRNRLAERRTVEQDFRARLAPLSEPAVLAARRRNRRALGFGFSVALAGVAAAVLLFVGRPPPDYVGIKGDPGMQIVCRQGGVLKEIATGDTIAPGDELRFVPRGIAPPFRFVIVASTDGEGRFTPFFPDDEAGQSVSLPPRGEPLPGGILIDHARGPEQITVLFSDVALRVADIKALLRPSGTASPSQPAPSGVRLARVEFSLPKRP